MKGLVTNIMEHLHKRMDKLFAKGNIWQHRTLRTIFDPYSSEWNDTTMEKKIEILNKIIASGEELTSVYSEYITFYKKEKPHVPGDAWESLIIYIETLLSNEPPTLVKSKIKIRK